MKLSEKGLKRLLDVAFDGDEFYQSNALEVEFEPDDFVGGCFQNGKDHVILTVEEATKICGAMNPVPRDCKLRDWFEKRIEQAEGK